MTSNTNCYFARSIRGGRAINDTAINKRLVHVIKGCGLTPQFELQVPILKGVISDEEYIYQRDLQWLDACQLVLADVTGVSHGVGYELAYAKHVCNIPVLCVTRSSDKPSAMILGAFGKVVRYSEPEELRPTLLEFAAKYRGEPENA